MDSNSGGTLDDRFDDGFADFTLVVENHRVLVHKEVLAVASPVFRDVLSSDATFRRDSVLDLTGKRYEDIILFLKCIYPGHHESVKASTVDKILPLAQEYQVTELLNKCCRILLKKVSHKSTARELFWHLSLAEASQASQFELLRTKCILLASELPVREMQEASTQYEVSDRSLIEMKDLALRRHELDRMDEQYIFSNHTAQSGSLKDYVSTHVANTPRRALSRNEELRAARLFDRFVSNDRRLLEVIKNTSVARETKNFRQYRPRTVTSYETEPGAPANTATPRTRPSTTSEEQIDEQEQCNLVPEKTKQKLELQCQLDEFTKSVAQF